MEHPNKNQPCFKTGLSAISSREIIIRSIFFLIFSVGASVVAAQQAQELSVDEIMKGAQWMGESPSNIRWGEDSKTIYFDWNPDNNENASLYQITTAKQQPQKVSDSKRRSLQKEELVYSKNRSRILFERNGDIFLKKIGETETRLTQTVERETNPVFNGDETQVIFQKSHNLYSLDISNGRLQQITNFTKVKPSAEDRSEQDQWLRDDQLAHFEVLQKREGEKNSRNADREKDLEALPKEIFLDEDRELDEVGISPDNRFVIFRLRKNPKANRQTQVPNYVTTSGYTENIPARSKVGILPPVYESMIYDRFEGKVYKIATEAIPGIKDIPDYLDEYPRQLEERRAKDEEREVIISSPLWNPDGSRAVVDIRARNNKDRWIMNLNLEDGSLSMLDRQHDEAWIGGPGIGRGFGRSELGWVDNNRIYYQSEETGYSHIYIQDVSNGSKKQLTSGPFEILSLQLSNDREKFFFTANIEHPGISHFYQLNVEGGDPVQLTAMKGGNEVVLSPNEKWLAIRHSYTTKPWELYIQENRPGAKAERITHSTSKEFDSYSWKDPEMVSFKNRYGSEIYAQVFSPENPDPNKPAVVFIHSNGYLQNVHYRWSYHYREYMFNNLLVDKGYTVINIDYTASSGYGRDMRTGIYRHMGGKDLSDLTDGVKWLTQNYDVNPANIGMYGGSYGGFLTLMGLFTEPEVFKSGAALRSVTDWAHYNHGYTSNILNTPRTDEKAYKRSSPIYFADGLQGHLLMTHGIVDVNVQFQDVIRLTQRLIELGKRNWDLAVYPLEDHDFIEPSSWADQYHRVLDLFEKTLRKK